MTTNASLNRSRSEACQQLEVQGRPSSSSVTSTDLAGKRAVAVVFAHYPADPRPRRAAEALAREGMDVEMICLKETAQEAAHQVFNGVDITRIPLKHRRSGKLSYLWEYGSFLLIAGGILGTRALRRRYDIVHIHNMPDFLVFSALLPKMLGARVILDLHDPMPELMMTIYGLRRDSITVRLLKMLEKASIRFADYVLTVNKSFREIFSTRSCPPEKISVIMNAPDEGIFQYRAAVRGRLTHRDAAQPFVIMYHGSLVERHGLDLAITALAKVRQTIPHAELRIYGRSTAFLEKMMEEVQRSELAPAVRYLGSKKLEEIADAIAECHVGIVPNRKSIFTELNTPTRIFEYLSQGKPVIAPRAPGVLDYFNETGLCFFNLGDAEDLAEKILYVFSHPEEIADMVERGQAVYRAHMWEQERARLIDVVANLLEPRITEQRETSSLVMGE